MIELRPYQARGVEAARSARRKGHRRILLVCPTGGGKSVLATHVAHRAASEFSQRVLVVVHNEELVGQWFLHFGRVGIRAGVMMGDDPRNDPSSPVQIGTSSTLVRRELPPADLVLVDECSMAVAETFAKILGHYTKATILGLTATPCRLDGKPLREQFDALVEIATYSELISLGAIVAPVVYAPERPLDLSGVGTRAGDYESDALERVSMHPHVVGDVVETWQRLAEGRRTVGFAVGVAHSKAIVAQFLAAGVRAAHVDGDTPKQERQDALIEIAIGRLQVLFGVNVFAYGLDVPPIKCAIVARPTLSLALHMQMCGRVLRPWGNLPPTILDHSGNIDVHGLPHEDRTWSLTGGSIRTQSKTTHHVCGGCFAYVEGFPCPLCGYAAARKPREVRQAPGSLRLVNGAPSPYSDPREAFFWAKVSEACRKGYQPGYASAKFKEKYGTWPPWDWSQRAKVMVDDEWREAIRKTTERREFWQGRQAARVSGMAPEHGFTAEPEED